jgi:glycosyltransferase involved in cell wall biosynthesis
VKKRVLSISHYYITNNRGGGEVMLHEMLKSLVKAGYSVDAIVTDTEGNTLKVDGVKVMRGRKHIKDIGNKKYDLVVSHFQEANMAMSFAKKMGIPSVYIIHNTMQPTTNTLISYSPTLAVFNTEWVRDFYKYENDHIIVHPPVYSSAHKTTPGNKVTLVNLIPSKGSNMFYNMSAVLPGIQFLGVKGGYYKSQQVVMARRNVEIMENTDDMKKDVWSKTKILLMPSSYESYGMVGVEAMASGIPVIASSTPGLIESLGYAGIFPKDEKIQTWRSHILTLLENPEKYREASELAIKRSSEIRPEIELNKFIEEIRKII